MISGLREFDIRRNTDPKTFARGEECVRNRAVNEIVRRGQIVQASVQGSDRTPYTVRLTIDAGGVREALCTCPYDWGGWCTHIVAVALICLRQPSRVQERPDPALLLSSLTYEELRQAVLGLARREPAWFEPLEVEIGYVQAARPAVALAPRRPSVDIAALGHRVHRAVRSVGRRHSSGRFWSLSSAMEEIRAIFDLAQSAVVAGDLDTALAIMTAVIDAYLRDWVDLDDSAGDATGLFYDFDELLAEALLQAALGPEARASWTKRIHDWQIEIMAAGTDEVFVLAHTVVELDESLLEEKILATGAPPELADLYLNVLERRGEHEYFLRLSHAAGRTLRHAHKLVELGRHADAIAYARQHFTNAHEMLAMAQTLRDQELHLEALELGAAGLDLKEPHAELAAWLTSYAAEHIRPELALRAAIMAFLETPEPALFVAARTHAGPEWPQVREDLLSYLHGREFGYDIAGPVNLFLQEGLVDEAVHLIDRTRFVEDDLLVEVAAAAAATHPQWVIGKLRPRAEQIMDEGLSGRYAEAVAWLRLIHAACVAGQQRQNWERYIQRLRERHGRKYKLMALLRDLDD